MPSLSPNTANHYRRISHTIKSIIAIFMTSLLLGFVEQTDAQGIPLAEFTLESYTIEADCNSSFVLIKWINSTEPYVVGFKVHVRSVEIDSGVTENRWVNPIAVVAKGAGQEYTIIDSAIKPNTYQTFRVYGFEENNLLSKTKQVILNDEYVLYCTRLPLTII